MTKAARNQQPALTSEGRLFDYASLEEAFPTVDPGTRPFGDRVLVQMRTAKEMSAGGIVLPHETQETEMWNTQVAKVISIGATAFRNQDTLEPWPEGNWVKPGMYIRVPKWGGDRWQIPIPGRRDKATFVMFKDLELGGEITGNPLDVIAYVY